METSSDIIEWLTAMALFGGLVASLEICFRFGQQARKRRAEQPDQLASIQGAMLGLLALLLGFSFALAAGRFSARSELIVDEANAIGTAWLRCDLLPNEQRDEVRGILRGYTDQRVAFYELKSQSDRAVAVAESEALQAKMWTVVATEAKSSPMLANLLLPPFNEVIDLHSTRVAAAQRHLPALLMALLLVCSLVSIAVVGYSCGVAGKRNAVLTTALSFLVAAVLWAIVDMDHPNRGLIHVGQQPMLDLQKSLGK